MKLVIAVVIWSAQIFAQAPAAVESPSVLCGEKSQFQSIQMGQNKFSFLDANTAESTKALSHIKLLNQKITKDEAKRVISLALQKGVDPYAMLALYASENKTVPLSTLSMAKAMGCAVRAKTDIKNFSLEDMAALKALEEKTIKLNSERAKLKGGDDFEEWKSIQKEIEKHKRSNEDLKAKLKSLTGEKKEEAKDQIIDNDEEIKGLAQEQLDFTKTPDMKRIVEIEKERADIKFQIDMIRSRAIKIASANAENKANSVEVQRELSCLKSENCIGLFLGGGAVAGQCLPGELLKNDAAILGKANPKGKVKQVCCAGEVDALQAASQSLADHFSTCMGSSPASECLSRYLEFKGDCAPVIGTHIALQVVKGLLTNFELHRWVKEFATAEQKPIVSLFCVATKKDEPIVLDQAALEAELAQLQLAHKKCKIK